MPDGPAFLTSLLAVSQAWGCAPLNPALAWPEIESLLRPLQPAAIILSAEFPALLDPVLRLGLPVLIAAAGDKVTWTSISTSSPRQLQQTDVAILLYTSATTGRSKLVGLSHANLAASMCSTCSVLQLTPADRVLLLSPLFHLQGILSAMSQLHAGGSVVAPHGFERGDFPRWLTDLKPTWYTCGPTLHRTICARLRTQGGHSPPSAATSLRFVRSIGAPLSQALAHDILNTLGVPVLNGYGLTETGVLTSVPLACARTHAVSVGGSTGAELRVVDANDRELPPGGEGEIVVRGPNVTSGYRNDPEATEAAFRGGWFHTGDLGRMDPDGFLYVTGRLKEQINRAGEKIHPGEIDEVLLSHPAVHEYRAAPLPRGETCPFQGATTHPSGRPHSARRHRQAETPRAHRCIWTCFRMARGEGVIPQPPTPLVVVPVQPGNPESRDVLPLFLLPPRGTETAGLRRLAKALGPDWPVSLVHPQTRWNGATCYPIEAAAEASAAVIREAQPHIPYVVGGYCLGGVIAFETARRLQHRGCVGLLLFDTPVPGYPKLTPRSLRSGALGRLLRVLREQWKQPGGKHQVCNFILKRIAWYSILVLRPLLEIVWRQRWVTHLLGEPIMRTPPFWRGRLDLPVLHILADASGSNLFLSAARFDWEPVAPRGITYKLVSGRHDFLFSRRNLPTLKAEIEHWSQSLHTPEPPMKPS